MPSTKLQGSDHSQPLKPAYDLVAVSASAIQLAGEMNTGKQQEEGQS
jgi:hypothetical protein